MKHPVGDPLRLKDNQVSATAFSGHIIKKSHLSGTQWPIADLPAHRQALLAILGELPEICAWGGMPWMPPEFGSTRSGLPSSVSASWRYHLGECALPSPGAPLSSAPYTSSSFCFLFLLALSQPLYGSKLVRRRTTYIITLTKEGSRLCSLKATSGFLEGK